MDYMLIIGISIFTVLEIAFPRRKQAFFKKGLLEDLFYFVLILGASYFGLLELGFLLEFVEEYSLIKVSFPNKVVEWILCLIVFDFIRFVTHFCLHRFDFLWRAHKLHHSTTELSVMSGFRNSYFEDFALVIFSLPFVIILSFDSYITAQVGTLFMLHGFFLHSNLKFRFKGWLSFLGCPYFHASHHIKERRFNYCNYGSTFTFWDKIFGTYYLPDNLEFENLGLYNGEKDEAFKGGHYLSRFFCLEGVQSFLQKKLK